MSKAIRFLGEMDGTAPGALKPTSRSAHNCAWRVDRGAFLRHEVDRDSEFAMTFIDFSDGSQVCKYSRKNTAWWITKDEGGEIHKDAAAA